MLEGAPSFSRSREKVVAKQPDEGGASAFMPLFSPLASSCGLLLAVSGGPDSTALLLLIDRWRKDTGVPVAVATVDHRLRAGSAQDAQAVAALCAARGLAHHTLVREGDAPKTRLQERARDARYALLVRCAKNIGADTIVTAHHADDQAETILMRLTRGSGPAGLAGMAALSWRDGVAIARPLLALPKADLVAICRAENVAFAEDPSNDNAAFRRVALRRLAATLTEQGLGADALRRLGRRAARAEAALQWAQDRARAGLNASATDDETAFPAQAFGQLPEEIALRLIGVELARLSPQAFRLERLETLAAALRAALLRDEPFAATLAGCAIRIRRGSVIIARAPARRTVDMTNLSSQDDEDRYLSSPPLLGKAEGDA